jgi:hypothetical protein
VSATRGKDRQEDKVRELQRTPYWAAKADPKRRFHALHDKVLRRDVLERAWESVRANQGAAGIDHTTIADVEQYGVSRLLDEPLSRPPHPSPRAASGTGRAITRPETATAWPSATIGHTHVLWRAGCAGRVRPVRRAGRGNGPAVTPTPRPVPTLRGHAEVAVAELALDDVERDAFAGEFDGVCVAELVGDEAAADAGVCGASSECGARGGG